MKVSIVCGNPNTELLAPFNDESWEIWVLGNRYDRFLDKRVTRIFEIHEDLSEHDPKYPEWLASFNIPIISSETFPIKAKHITPFPYKEAIAIDPDGVSLASSSAYMMAYALLLGATEISIYGVDMAVDDHEYFWQRPCMWGWVKFARGRGIKVYIPKESALCHMDYMEGRDWRVGKKTETESQFALRPFTRKQFLEMAESHRNKIDELQAQINILQINIATYNGAAQVYERLAKVARAVEAGVSDLELKSSLTLK